MQYRFQVNNIAGFFYDSGTSSLLMNGGSDFGNGFSNYDGFNQFTLSDGFLIFPSQRGSVGGVDGPEAFGSGIGPGAERQQIRYHLHRAERRRRQSSPIVRDGKGNPIQDSNKNPVLNLPGSDPSRFIPWGPEYECQVVNPQFAVSGGSEIPGGRHRRVSDYVIPLLPGRRGRSAAVQRRGQTAPDHQSQTACRRNGCN